jgi:hypothetical protein
MILARALNDWHGRGSYDMVLVINSRRFLFSLIIIIWFFDAIIASGGFCH